MRRGEGKDEDLMTEAVSLVKRIECRYPSRPDPATIGFNNLGWLFVYLGSDPMYRFDEQGRLRRAFVDGYLFRTTGQTLARLERQTETSSGSAATQVESTLSRNDLSQIELDAFRLRMLQELNELLHGLRCGSIDRQHPSDAIDLKPQFEEALMRVLESPDFLAPAIVRR